MSKPSPLPASCTPKTEGLGVAAPNPTGVAPTIEWEDTHPDDMPKLPEYCHVCKQVNTCCNEWYCAHDPLGFGYGH